MAIEEKEEQTTSLKELIELVEKDPVPSNVFTIEDKDPMVILGKINEVIAYLKNLQTTINASDSKANQALENAIIALSSASESLQASTTALNSSNKALETANLAIDTANNSLASSNDAKTASNEALNLSSLANETAKSAKTIAENAKERAETANVISATALDTAGEAYTKADNAIEEADSAISTANEANTKADNAVERADSAISTANEANTKANDASTSSSEALTKANDALQVAQDALNQVVGGLGSKVYDNNGNIKTSVKFAGHNGVNVDLAEDNETFDIRLDEDITKAIEDNHSAIEQTKAQAQANADDIVNITDMLAGVEEKVETDLPNRLSNVESNLTEINPKVARALLTPMSAPSELKLVGIDNNNNQEMLGIGSGLKVDADKLKIDEEILNNIELLKENVMTPSDTGSIAISVGSGRTYYTATANGYIYCRYVGAGSGGTKALLINYGKDTTHTNIKLMQSCWAQSWATDVGAVIPCKKGDIVEIYFSAGSSYSAKFVPSENLGG